ncbi:hypothetical protein JM658_16810 [Joostella atrarenae]|uniref:Uncharacterized protein n=1 Tax=Joostella atrarenae TaxID=679257 RepID=A0ABS9J7T0_9FLAO|nr:hypothetical protein [Joostella atrarenae]MCF8716485.1 hypothetical protein [Joostella atrarenae]
MTIHLANEEQELIIESIEHRIIIDPKWSDKLNPILNELRLKYNHTPHLHKSHRLYISGCLEELLMEIDDHSNLKNGIKHGLALKILNKLNNK